MSKSTDTPSSIPPSSPYVNQVPSSTRNPNLVTPFAHPYNPYIQPPSFLPVPPLPHVQYNQRPPVYGNPYQYPPRHAYHSTYPPTHLTSHRAYGNTFFAHPPSALPHQHHQLALLQTQNRHLRQQILQEQCRQDLISAPSPPTSQPAPTTGNFSSTIPSSCHRSARSLRPAIIVSDNNNETKHTPLVQQMSIKPKATTQPTITNDTPIHPPRRRRTPKLPNKASKRPTPTVTSTAKLSDKGALPAKLSDKSVKTTKGVNKPVGPNIHVDTGLVERSWSELLSRQDLPHRHLKSIIHSYAYEHYQTPKIMYSNSGSNVGTRRYECAICKKWSITLECLNLKDFETVGTGGSQGINGKNGNANKIWKVVQKQVHVQSSTSKNNWDISSHLVECTCKEDTTPTVTRAIIANSPYFKNLITNVTSGPLEKKTLSTIKEAMRLSHPGISNVSEQYLYQCKKAVLNSFNHIDRPDRYARLPAFLLEMAKRNKSLSIALQAAGGTNEFFRYFHAFPIAKFLGILTMAISVIDCCHFKCNSYDGVILLLVSKTGFGRTILLGVAILPVEDTGGIVWFIQNCWRHGMTLDVPIFTDQGPMLAAARALYDKFKVRFLLVLCIQHIIRRIRANFSSLYGKGKVAKKVDYVIRSSLNGAHYAPNRYHFFETIQTLVLSLMSIRPDVKPVCIDVGLYLLSLRPGLWTVYGNTPDFDNANFELQHKQTVANMFAAKMFLQKAPKLENSTLPDLFGLFTSCIGYGVEACATYKFKNVDFNESSCALMGCSKTNIVESFNFVTKSTGARYQDPPTFIRLSYELYNIQVNQLLADLSTCKHSPLTTIGTKIKVHTSTSANSDLITDLPKGDEFMYSPMHNDCPGTLSATFKDNAGFTYDSSVSWYYDPTGELIFSHNCAKHPILTSQYRCPCCCVYYICQTGSDKKKTYQDWPKELSNLSKNHAAITRYLYPQCLLASYNYDFLQKNNGQILSMLKLDIPSTTDCTTASQKFYGISPSGEPVECTTLLPPPKYKKRLNNVPRFPSNGEGFGSPQSTGERRSKRRKNEGGQFANSQTKMVGVKKPSEPFSKMLGDLKTDESQVAILYSRENLDIIKGADDKQKLTYGGPKSCTTCRQSGHTYVECVQTYTTSGEIIAASHISPGSYLVYCFRNEPAVLGRRVTYNPSLPPIELQALSKLSKEDDSAFYDPQLGPFSENDLEHGLDGDKQSNHFGDQSYKQSNHFADQSYHFADDEFASKKKGKTIHTERHPSRENSCLIGAYLSEAEDSLSNTPSNIYRNVDSLYGKTLDKEIDDGCLFRKTASVSHSSTMSTNAVLQMVVRQSVSKLDPDLRQEFLDDLPTDCSIHYCKEPATQTFSQEPGREVENLDNGVGCSTQTEDLLKDSCIFRDAEMALGVSGNTDDLLTKITKNSTTDLPSSHVIHTLDYYVGNGTSIANVPITQGSLSTLNLQQYVGGECIDMILHLLGKTKCGKSTSKTAHLLHIIYQTSFFSTLVSNVSEQQEGYQEGRLIFEYKPMEHYRSDCNIFECQSLYIPICNRGHWILCVVRMKEKSLYFYDSLHTDPTAHFMRFTCAPAILKFIRERSKPTNRAFNINTWKVVLNPLPQQSVDSNDCGVFLILAVIGLVVGKAFNFSQDTIFAKNTRQNLKDAILQQDLSVVDIQGSSYKKTHNVPTLPRTIKMLYDGVNKSYIPINLESFFPTEISSTQASCPVSPIVQPVVTAGINVHLIISKQSSQLTSPSVPSKRKRSIDVQKSTKSEGRKLGFLDDDVVSEKVATSLKKKLFHKTNSKTNSVARFGMSDGSSDLTSGDKQSRKPAALTKTYDPIVPQSVIVEKKPAAQRLLRMRDASSDYSSGDELLRKPPALPKMYGPIVPQHVIEEMNQAAISLAKNRKTIWLHTKIIDWPMLFTREGSHFLIYEIDKNLQYLNRYRNSLDVKHNHRYIFPFKHYRITRIGLIVLAKNRSYNKVLPPEIIDLATQWMLMQTSDSCSSSKAWFPLPANTFELMPGCSSINKRNPPKVSGELLGIGSNLFDCNVLDIVVCCEGTYSIMFVLNLDTFPKKGSATSKNTNTKESPYACIIHYFQDHQPQLYSVTCAKVVRTFLNKLEQVTTTTGLTAATTYNFNNLPLHQIPGKYIVFDCNLTTELSPIFIVLILPPPLPRQYPNCAMSNLVFKLFMRDIY